jgi:protein arginine kinase activator
MSGMAEGNKCYFCGKPATVHFTQIINNKILKMNLCEECARKYGIGEPPSFSLSDILSKTDLFGETPEETEATCPECGFALSDAHFKKGGLLGCPHCYEAFRETLAGVMKDLHQGATHQGKVPHNATKLKKAATKTRAPRKAKASSESIQTPPPQKSAAEELAELERKMQQAIKEEAYEQAAVLRDKIAALKGPSQGPTPPQK